MSKSTIHEATIQEADEDDEEQSQTPDKIKKTSKFGNY